MMRLMSGVISLFWDGNDLSAFRETGVHLADMSV